MKRTNTNVPRHVPGAFTTDRFAELAELARQLEEGTISEDEFRKEKKRLLEAG